MKQALLLVLVLAGTVPAQGEAALAHSLLQAVAPAIDDPDASLQQLVATALQHGDSPLACLLLEEALRRTGDLQQPHLLLQVLQRRPRLGHGLAELRAQELLLRLQFAAGVIASDPACRLPMPVNDPFAQHAASALAIGPFGDEGDYWTGVCFPPELEFPAPGAAVPGRTGPVTARVVARRPFTRRLTLALPARPEPGCYYALHRVLAATAQPCLLEVESDGAVQVFVNGREQGRIDPMLDMGPYLRWLPAVLAAGTNHVLLKTCSNGRTEVSLRYVDQRLRPQAGLVEVAATVALAPAPAPAAEGAPTPPPDVVSVLQQAAAAAQAVQQEQLLVAAALAAWRRVATEKQWRLLATADTAPPQDPLARLCLAQVVRATEQWPEEQRNATAWALEEATLPGLGDEHHAAAMARVRHLEQQDRAEEGLRLLRTRIDQGRAGPLTCDAAFRIAQRLRFDGEQPFLLAAWTRLCPDDPRPLLLLGRRAAEDGDGKAALALCCRALARRPGDQPALQAVLDLCQECGGRELGEAVLSLMFPPRLRPLEVPLALATARLALARSDADRRRELAAVVAHPDADPPTLRRAGERLLQLGDAAAAAAAWRKSLALEGDQPSLRELLARSGNEALPQKDLERFRRDAAAVLATFTAGERERTASTTMLLDQMIVEVLPDGSRIEEVHQLRRINDQEGVEAMREAQEAAAADELLLLRTIGVDGKSYVPLRVGRTLAMPRLEPGAFLEWRYRNHHRSPGPGPWRGPHFSFRSGHEPFLLSELVLVLPVTGRGEVRSHEFAGTPERVPLDGDRQALVFRMQDQPRLPDEQRAPPEQELVPAVGYGQDALPAAGLRSAKIGIRARSRAEPAVRDLAARLLQDRTTDGERVAAIAAFCDQEIERGPADNPTSTLLRKKGDRFLLQLALLEAAGFTVQAGLCADERGPGSDIGELFADWRHLAVACARVQLREGAPLWLFRDSARYWPIGAVPGSRVGARALIDVAGAPELTRVPGPDGAVARALVVRGTARLDAEGMVALRCRVEIGDAAGFEIAERLRQATANERELAARQMAQGLFQGWRVRSAVAVLEPRAPMRLDAELQRRLLQPGSDGRSLLPLPMPPGQFVAQFGDRSERQLTLCIDEEAAFDWQLEFDPGPFRPAQLPPPVVVQHGTLDYSLQWTQVGERLQLRRRVGLRACRIPVTGFAAWMRTLEQIDRAEQQNLTLVRDR